MSTVDPTGATPASTSLGVVAALERAAHRVARQIADAVAPPDGPGLDEWRVLDLLADGAGHPMSETATHAMIPAPTATKLIDRLVHHGLVSRQPHHGDRRRILVFTSAAGRELHAALTPTVQAIEQELRSAAGPDVDVVLAALRRIG